MFHLFKEYDSHDITWHAFYQRFLAKSYLVFLISVDAVMSFFFIKERILDLLCALSGLLLFFLFVFR